MAFLKIINLENSNKWIIFAFAYFKIAYLNLNNPQKSIIMSTQNWSYLQNPFDNATKRNFKKMLRLATDHFDKLRDAAATDVFIKQIYLEAVTAYDEFVQTYQDVITYKAAYQMHTRKLEEQMELLSNDKIKRWDIQIQSVYIDTDAEYLALLPNNRTPFQKGAYELRINECFSLAAKLVNFPALSHTQAAVAAFAQNIKTVRSEQQAIERKVSDLSTLLEKNRVALAKAMQKAFSGLMYHFSDEVEKVENFYELQHLRAANSTPKADEQDEMEPTDTAQNSIAENAIVGIFTDKLTPNTEILIENNSNVTLEVWTGESVRETPPNRKLLISPQQSVSCLARDFSTGNIKELILNNTDNITGSYKAAIYVPD